MTTLADRLEGVIHEPTQVRDDRVDLSLADVEAVREPGRIDFGGDELEAAEVDPVEMSPRDPDDDYGRYDPTAGGYVVEFDESLAGDGPVLLQSRQELLARGGAVPTARTDELGPVSCPFPTGSATVTCQTEGERPHRVGGRAVNSRYPPLRQYRGYRRSRR